MAPAFWHLQADVMLCLAIRGNSPCFSWLFKDENSLLGLLSAVLWMIAVSMQGSNRFNKGRTNDICSVLALCGKRLCAAGYSVCAVTVAVLPCVEHIHPSCLTTALAYFAGNGMTRPTVHSCCLWQGRHVQMDIDEEVAEDDDLEGEEDYIEMEEEQRLVFSNR